MVRTTQYTLKYANQNKQTILTKLFVDYKEMLELYIHLIITDKLPLKQNLSSKILPNTDNIQHSRWKSIVYKQASEIVRSNISYQKKRIYKKLKKIYFKWKKQDSHKWFTESGKKFYELNINFVKRININLKDLSLNLDYRVFDIEQDKSKEFDEFVNIRLPYFIEGKRKAKTIKIPIKYHKHHHKYNGWFRKNFIQIKEKNINFVWEKDELEKPKKILNEIGIDIGFKKLISDSNGNFYGKNLEQIYRKIANKKRGSKAYKRALAQRTNETNKATNEFFYNNDFDNLVIEDLKQVKFKSKLHKKVNNFLQYWSYRILIDKLTRLSEEKGFLLTKVEPAYTSQRCSNCGTIDKKNRQGETYQCGVCNTILDADYNAARNVLRLGVYSL